MIEIVIATKNIHKARELRQLLSVSGICWRSLADFSEISQVRETGRSFEENAVKKAKALAKKIGLTVLADDSGLEVDFLEGLPGVRSARFAGAHGDNAANNRCLLRKLEGLPSGERKAQYRCVLALASPERLLAITCGSWRGRIATSPKGKNGFGYDPVFFLPRFKKTVAQMPFSFKQKFSHRAKAAASMREILKRLALRCRAKSKR